MVKKRVRNKKQAECVYVYRRQVKVRGNNEGLRQIGVNN